MPIGELSMMVPLTKFQNRLSIFPFLIYSTVFLKALLAAQLLKSVSWKTPQHFLFLWSPYIVYKLYCTIL